MKNYRKYYQEITGIQIDLSFDIHHIDGNRGNNDINNLVHLPKKLHNDFHKLRNEISMFNTEIMQLGSNDKVQTFNNAYVDTIIRYNEVLKKCSEYIDLRNYCYYKQTNIIL